MKILSLGESMIRLSTDEGTLLANATSLNLEVGGAEANVAINLSQLDHDVAYATKLPVNNPWSLQLERLLDSYQIDRSNLIYGPGRMGSYFLEKGSGLRPSKVIYDRAYSVLARMSTLEWDLDQLFDGVDWLHMTGITCALSPSWQDLSLDIIKEAKSRGVKISFDMNFRQTMWSHEEATRVYQEILPLVDVLSAGRLDAIHFMGIEDQEDADWNYYAEAITNKYPNIQYLYGTNRVAMTPNTYRLQGFVWSHDCGTVASPTYELEEVVDRVGAGDAYAAAVLDGIILEKDLQEIADFAIAASVLKHTVEGDINLFCREEIENFTHNGANIVR